MTYSVSGIVPADDEDDGTPSAATVMDARATALFLGDCADNRLTVKAGWIDPGELRSQWYCGTSRFRRIPFRGTGWSPGTAPRLRSRVSQAQLTQ